MLHAADSAGKVATATRSSSWAIWGHLRALWGHHGAFPTAEMFIWPQTALETDADGLFCAFAGFLQRQNLDGPVMAPQLMPCLGLVLGGDDNIVNRDARDGRLEGLHDGISRRRPHYGLFPALRAAPRSSTWSSRGIAVGSDRGLSAGQGQALLRRLDEGRD